MSHLHTINSPDQLVDCLRILNSGDGLLLIEDGVYARSNSLDSLPPDIALYALSDDVDARGLASRLPDGITSISQEQFVRLCCEHDKVINWF